MGAAAKREEADQAHLVTLRIRSWNFASRLYAFIE